MILRHPVTSSAIKSAGYDAAAKTMQVEMKGNSTSGNRVYDYPGVEPHQFQAFMDSPSKGKHLSKHFRAVK